MIPRARSLSRKQTAAATGPASRVSQPSGAPERHSAGELLEAGDAAGRDRLDRAGRDEVDADPARSEVAREVARDALERRLGDAHPVVHRPGDGGVEVEADDRAAALAGLQQRRERGGERLQRERAGLEGRDRAARGRVEEAAAESVRGREGDRMQHAVEAAPARAQLLGDALEVFGRR